MFMSQICIRDLYSAPLFCMKRIKMECGGIVKPAAEEVTESNWRLCKKGELSH